jgi:hypothetical protein
MSQTGYDARGMQEGNNIMFHIRNKRFSFCQDHTGNNLLLLEDTVVIE